MSTTSFKPNIAIAAQGAHNKNNAIALSQQLNLPLCSIDNKTYKVLLVVTDQHLQLQLTAKDTPGPIYIDFLSGSLAHRHYYGGGKNQLLARAVGLSKKKNINIIDVTAGLGRDAFILATLGCNVTMIERSPIIAALLKDAINKSLAYTWFQELQLQLINDDAFNFLKNLSSESYPDVIYCDPMFSDRGKSALVKKEMRILRHVVGDDYDAGNLLESSLQKAKSRVVIKRARAAPHLTEQKPSLIYSGKSSRFDVYLIS